MLTDLDVIDREKGETSIPIIEVWNKIDLLEREQAEPALDRAENDEDVAAISAASGQGVDQLVEMLGKRLTAKAVTREFLIPASDGQRIAWLHAHGEILEDSEGSEETGGPMRRIVVRLNPKEAGQFESL